MPWPRGLRHWRGIARRTSLRSGHSDLTAKPTTQPKQTGNTSYLFITNLRGQPVSGGTYVYENGLVVNQINSSMEINVRKWLTLIESSRAGPMSNKSFSAVTKEDVVRAFFDIDDLRAFMESQWGQMEWGRRH